MQGEQRHGRAIVTHSRSWQALAVIRSLGRRGIEVVAGDEIQLTPGALSRYSVASFTYPSPEADPEGFLSALEGVADEHAPPAGEPFVLLPVFRETRVVAGARERLGRRLAVPLPPAEVLERVGDKASLLELAREHRVPTPPTWMPESARELEEVAAEIPLPAFVKLRRGFAGMGLQRVESRQRLGEVYREMVRRHRLGPGDRPIVQAAVPGEDLCVTGLFDRGRLLARLSYRNLQTLVETGPGTARETVEAPAAEAATERLLGGVGWHGIAQVDFIRPESGGPPCLIEVNPRFFTGLFQAIASGVDYPWMLFCLAAGREVEEPGEPQLGLETETPVLGLLATLREIAASAGRIRRLRRAWAEARGQAADGAIREALGTVAAGMREEVGIGERVSGVRQLLEEREGRLSQLMESDDPGAWVGLLYPLALFLRHGRLTPEVLAGIPPAEEEKER